mgnify:CR=1 FL=1
MQNKNLLQVTEYLFEVTQLLKMVISVLSPEQKMKLQRKMHEGKQNNELLS